jgi:hypothetical protein
MNDHLRLGLTILVGIGWMFNLVAPAFLPSYDSNLAANGPLLLILGSLFATRRSSDKSEEKDK